MSTPMTRIGKVGVLGHLDELELLMREYCEFRNKIWQELKGPHSDSSDITTRLTMSSFLHWLRQRQRESVAVATTKGE